MRLSCVILDPSSGLNSLDYIPQASFSSGDNGQLWLQLIDLDFPIAPNVSSRYMPAAGATLSVNFFSYNDAHVFSKPATQPFPQDPSIWYISLSSYETQRMAGPNIGLTLVQGAQINKAVVRNVLSVSPKSPFQC